MEFRAFNFSINDHSKYQNTVVFLSLWDGLIALQLFATWYSIVGIPIVHCGHLLAYSNQQPLTQVEYVLNPDQICLFVF